MDKSGINWDQTERDLRSKKYRSAVCITCGRTLHASAYNNIQSVLSKHMDAHERKEELES